VIAGMKLKMSNSEIAGNKNMYGTKKSLRVFIMSIFHSHQGQIRKRVWREPSLSIPVLRML
jgi:hypothetical protein